MARKIGQFLFAIFFPTLMVFPATMGAELPRDLDLKNADLHGVLRDLAETEGVNITKLVEVIVG